jgi:hypothetical protein
VTAQAQARRPSDRKQRRLLQLGAKGVGGVVRDARMAACNGKPVRPARIPLSTGKMSPKREG